MERWLNRVAVVTGASSGIGSAIAKDLVNSGLTVIGLARRIERVKELQEKLPAAQRNRLVPLYCDVGSEKSVNEAFDWICQHYDGIDILVNNAGTLQTGQLVDMKIAHIQQVIQTNIMGIVLCTQRAYRSMRERQFDGHIVLINSILGHKLQSAQVGVAPDLNIYPPSKHAVNALTEMYRQEFLGLGTRIKVTSISPGAVDTEIIPDSLRHIANKTILQSEDISQAVLFAIATPPHVQIHELTIKPLGEII
ncbi:farnesol dehydrogenase [Drosophila tropicalis]|uniref:farnesol dehydrogenase n=1 Tax=Drosophila tropicalis TaxID=46794 RepID=UPI0035AB93C9